MQVSRRHFLGTAAAIGAATGVSTAAHAATDAEAANLRDLGVSTASTDDQSAAFQVALDAAARGNGTLIVPPGTYRVSNLIIKDPVRLIGTPGRSVLQYSGAGAFVTIDQSADVGLHGLTFDGELQPLNDAHALVTASGCRNLQIEQCQFLSSAAGGLALERCSGRIAACTFADAMKAALFSIDATGLEITGNTVRDCFNNGILVWRSEKGEDGTLVTNNRIERVGALDGGSGQNGNGINIYRAGNVIVAQNRITDCAFSAVRSNAGSACQIIGNSCARLGEVAIYAEFGFEGAIIASNVIETAASGISITNFNEGGRLAVCSNNIVRDLFVRPGEVDGRGVGISAEADTVIEGNVVENAPVHGIALGWKHYLRDAAASNNVLRNCRIGIGVSVSSGAGSASVSNNMISGSNVAAIAGLERDEIVTADLSAPGVSIPANMMVQGNLVS